MRVTRHEEFEAAHILTGYDGGCGNLHGHSYKIEVTFEGQQDASNYGFVADFNILKQIIKDVLPDHKMMFDNSNLGINTPEDGIINVLDAFNLSYVVYQFAPSAENLVAYFAEEIQHRISKCPELENIRVVEVKLWETTNSYATWKLN
jgi:6-pyruvoyltetrahydropterin/6-carboxytetrahydropterin synthase